MLYLADWSKLLMRRKPLCVRRWILDEMTTALVSDNLALPVREAALRLAAEREQNPN
jgi:hypothetical protein